MDKLSKKLFGNDYNEKVKKFDLEIQKKQDELGIDLRSFYTVVTRSDGTVNFQPDSNADLQTVEIIRRIFLESFR